MEFDYEVKISRPEKDLDFFIVYQKSWKCHETEKKVHRTLYSKSGERCYIHFTKYFM